MVKIMLDPGHGGSDPGAVGNGLREKDLTLSISKKIRDRLKDYENVQVKLSREGDQTLSLSARANAANAWGADYYMSIHINSAAGSNGTGFETFIYNGGVNQPTIASQNVVHAEILKAIGMKDRGKKRANFLVLRTTRMNAILTENGFINNPADAALLKQDAFLDKVAQGHVNGLVAFYGLKMKPTIKAATIKEVEPVTKRDINIVSDWAADDWEEARVNGYFDGSRPGAPITREEAAIVVNRLRKNILELIEHNK